MEKTIKIDGKPVKFKTSAAIPLLYRIKFRKDIFSDMQKIAKSYKDEERKKKEEQEKCRNLGIPFDENEYESGLPVEVLETFERVSYLMSRHADPSQPDDMMDWLDQFETFSIYEVLPEILDLWQSGTQQMSTPKKGKGK